MHIPDNYDWQTREDASTIMAYNQIMSDPERAKNAKACLDSAVKTIQKSAGKITVSSRHNNPATVKKLNGNYCK